PIPPAPSATQGSRRTPPRVAPVKLAGDNPSADLKRPGPDAVIRAGPYRAGTGRPEPRGTVSILPPDNGEMSVSCSGVLNLTARPHLVDGPPKYRLHPSFGRRCEHGPTSPAVLPAGRAGRPGCPPPGVLADARVGHDCRDGERLGGGEEQPRDVREPRHPQGRARKIHGRLRGRRRKSLGRLGERRSHAVGCLELAGQVTDARRGVPKAGGGLHVPA